MSYRGGPRRGGGGYRDGQGYRQDSRSYGDRPPPRSQSGQSGGGRFQPGHQRRGGRGSPQLQERKPCTFFTWTGGCRYSANCRDLHKIRNVGHFPDAHKGTIYCAAALPLDVHIGSFQIFTGGQDNSVKRWSVTPLARTGAALAQAARRTSLEEGLLPDDAIAPPASSVTSPSSGIDTCTFYDVKLENTTPFEAAVTSILLTDEVLFCGMKNGQLRGFARDTGQQFDLIGHQKEIYGLALIDTVLISGDFGGQLHFWKAGVDAAGSRPAFTLVQSLKLDHPIKCLKEVIIPMQEGSVKTLWIGGVGQVSVLNLATMQVSPVFRLPVPETHQKGEICMQLLPFTNTILAGCISGSIFQYRMDGVGQATFKDATLGGVMCMDGVATDGAPMLAVGSGDGWLSFLELPLVQESFTLQAHYANIRAVVTVDPSQHPGCPRAPPFIITASEDSCISLWTLTTCNDKRPQTR